MEKKPLREQYSEHFKKLSGMSVAPAKIDSTNVYQPKNWNTRKIMDKLVEDNVLPESHVEGIENFENFYDQVAQGKHGLILMEHYSNTDLPALFYLLEHSGNEKLADLSRRIVAIAGMKLNESGAFVRLYAESFTRVVVYPSRSQASFQGTPEEKEAEVQRAKKINFAAMRAMDQCKKRGQIILVFPAGTRYRPGKEETKRGLREMDSYLRLFDNMVLLSLNGNCLKINPDTPDDMLSDILEPEKITITASPVIECKAYRKKVIESLPADCPDPKQATVDEMMKILYEMHEKEDKIRAQEK